MGKTKQSKVSRLRLATLNNVSRLLAEGTLPNFLVLAPEVILGQGDSGSNWELHRGGSWLVWALDWLVCIWQHCHRGVICYLEELACPGKGSLSLASKAPRFQNTIQHRWFFFNVSNILSGYSPWEKKVQVGPEQIKDTAQRKGPGFQTTPIGVRFQPEK